MSVVAAVACSSPPPGAGVSTSADESGDDQGGYPVTAADPPTSDAIARCPGTARQSAAYYSWSIFANFLAPTCSWATDGARNQLDACPDGCTAVDGISQDGWYQFTGSGGAYGNYCTVTVTRDCAVNPS
jgi:hypothetical protein